MSKSDLLHHKVLDAPVAANTSHSMESKKTSATAAQPERADMRFDLTFDNVKVSMLSSLPERQLVDNLLVRLNLTSFMQGKYHLKRKAPDEHEAASKRPRALTKNSALLETEDLSAKLEFRNSVVMKVIESFQKIIRDKTSVTLGTKMEGWCKAALQPMRQNCDEGLKRCELRKQLSELLKEYKSNRELMEESWKGTTYCSTNLGSPISALMACNNDYQIWVLGMQKFCDILDEKRADIVSKVVKLEKEMKDLGSDFI